MKALNIWKQDYRLDEMNLKDLFVAFFMYLDIHIYLVLAAVSGYLAWHWGIEASTTGYIILAVAVAYPMVWYLLHRYILHGQFLYRSKITATAWKRIHFDHHRDPYDLKVLFGALYTTLPTIFIATSPIGYAIGGLAGMATAISAGIIMTCIYEFCHCGQHLNYEPKTAFFRKIKRWHLQHHFFNENVNFGIITFWPDMLFGTFKPSAKDQGGKSPTVFNLGYTGEEVRLYPWVARLTPDLDEERSAIEGVDRKKPTRKLAS